MGPRKSVLYIFSLTAKSWSSWHEKAVTWMAVGVRPVCRACLWPIGVVVAVLAARVCSLRPAHRLQRSSSSSSQHMASCAGLQRMGFACVRVHGVASAVQGGGGGGCSAALRRPTAPPQRHSTARSLHSFFMQARIDVHFHALHRRIMCSSRAGCGGRG